MEQGKIAISNALVVVRGGGDLATGVIQKLYRSGFRVLILETDTPLAIRRTVALGNAVFTGHQQVEDMEAIHVQTIAECEQAWKQQKIPLLVDPEGKAIAELQPKVVVDAILAKRNLGTTAKMAPIVIALGPGFSAPEEADAVVETMRGHTLGKLIFSGKALPNTGVPGMLGGKSAERVIHAPAAGQIKHYKKIGDIVKKGERLFQIEDFPVYSPLDGTLRGLISEEVAATVGLKCADVDPRPAEEVDCFSISDKARALGGAVLEAIFYLSRLK